MTSKTFAISPGWKFSGPIEAHRRAPLIVRPMLGSSGSSRNTTPSKRERIPVLLEQTRVADEEQRHHERDHRDGDPPGLDPRQLAVESRDGHEPDPVERGGEREQGGVGAGREAPYRDVGDEVQAEDRREERPQVRGQLRPVRERDEDVAATGDDDDEQPERELRTAARAVDDAGRHGTGVTGAAGATVGGRSGSVVVVGRVVVVVDVVVVDVASTRDCSRTT